MLCHRLFKPNNPRQHNEFSISIEIKTYVINPVDSYLWGSTTPVRFYKGVLSTNHYKLEEPVRKIRKHATHYCATSLTQITDSIRRDLNATLNVYQAKNVTINFDVTTENFSAATEGERVTTAKAMESVNHLFQRMIDVRKAYDNDLEEILNQDYYETDSNKPASINISLNGQSLRR